MIQKIKSTAQIKQKPTGYIYAVKFNFYYVDFSNLIFVKQYQLRSNFNFDLQQIYISTVINVEFIFHIIIIIFKATYHHNQKKNMWNTAISNLSEEEEDINEEFSILEQSSERVFKILPKTIHLTKQRFYNFIDEIGNLKFEPLELEPYKADFAQVKLEKNIDLEAIKTILQNTIRKMTVNKRQKKNWSKDDFIIMLWVIEKYNALHDKVVEEYVQEDWLKISSLVPGKDHHQCMFKWLGLKRNKYTEKYPWTETEESLLKVLVQESNPNHWFEVSKELYLQNTGFKVYRSPKQCRQRWACYLNPKLKKGPWCPEQDMILLGKYLEIGKKWSNIAKLLNGRTENAVKNRFNLILEKKQKLKSKMSDQDFIRNHLQNIQINMFMKTSDSTPKTLVFSDFTSQMNKEEFVKQTSTTKDQSEDYQNSFQSNTILSDYDNLSQTGQERKNTQFVTFKNIRLEDLLHFAQNIFPAQYDEENVEINFAPLKPIIKINNQKINSYEPDEFTASNNLMEYQNDSIDFASNFNDHFLQDEIMF